LKEIINEEIEELSKDVEPEKVLEKMETKSTLSSTIWSHIV